MAHERENKKSAKAEVIDSHNYNCYLYLQQIAEKTPNDVWGLQQFPELKAMFEPDKNGVAPYNKDISYANIYNTFLSNLEEKISEDKLITPVDKSEFTPWLDAIYNNHNSILEKTYERIRPSLDTRRLVDSRPQSRVKKELNKHDLNPGHRYTPQQAGSTWGRFYAAFISSDFKPMLTTSIPSSRDYGYTKGHHPAFPQELRFGTQAQRHNNEPRISPLFKKWLEFQTPKSGQQISHVYFNLLGMDRKDAEGRKEKALSEELHRLEDNTPNIAVITLPADKGFMQKHDYLKTNKTIKASEAFATFEKIALGTSDEAIQDFHISERTKEILYKENGKTLKESEQETVHDLLNASFTAVGIDVNDSTTSISRSQQQAAWFHFCKYEFPRFVNEKLQPKTFNMSCKDAIDRGGVASTYYNLMKSFETDTPLTRDEFDQGLHAAAALVKGRGLNHHYEVVWNAVDAYVNANLGDLKTNPGQSWLIHWRNDNIPHARITNERIKEIADQNHEWLTKEKETLENKLNTPSEDEKDKIEGQILLIDRALASVNAAREQTAEKGSGKRLLMDVVSNVTQLAIVPNKIHDDVMQTKMQRINNELNSNTFMGKLRGCFKQFVGALLSFTKFGRNLFQKGAETRHAYNDASKRRKSQMVNHFREILKEDRQHEAEESNAQQDPSSNIKP